MPFRGERQPIWNHQKGIYKPALLGPQGAALTIQTSFDGPYDDRLPGEQGSDDRFVYRYRGTDPDHAEVIPDSHGAGEFCPSWQISALAAV